MYKSQLQELCQRRSWPLPEYTTVKEGPLHGPHFKATVVVNGIAFESSDFFKRAKDAQIEAAKLALAHFTSPAPDGSTVVGKSPAPEINIAAPADKNCASVEGASDVSITVKKRPMADEIRTPVVEEQVQTSEKTSDTKRNKHPGELHIYKNQLQSVVLKKGYDLPIYTFEREGPPHNSRFKSKVTINGQVYESPDFFSTLKESEHAAAKVALLSLVPPEAQDAIIDKSVFKNLLQELAQKSGLELPFYNTIGSGASHMLTFVSTVLVGGETFLGEEAKTKKHAEMNAAEVAYNWLSQREIPGTSACASVSVSKSVSASSLQACGTSDYSGATNQLGAPSKLISSQNDTGCRKSGNQEAPKQIPSCAVSMHANPKDLSEHIPLSQGKGSSPPTPSEVMHGSVPVSNSDFFSGSSSSPRNVVRVYPRMLNMDFPVGSVVQHSDDKWIAVKFPANHHQTGH